jgi:hypothetical protein
MRYLLITMLLMLGATPSYSWEANNYEGYSSVVSVDTISSHYLIVYFPYTGCGNTSIKIVDITSNPNTMELGEEIELIVRIDKLDPWDLKGAPIKKENISGKLYLTVSYTIPSEFIGELITGSYLRIKASDVISKWSLKGSSVALSIAYQHCIQSEAGDKQYFKKPNMEDEEFF